MFIADFHIHSRYSRATSKDCVPEWLDFWARQKGLDLIGTGDFTHPAWRQELREKLEPTGDGLYVLKREYAQESAAHALHAPRFIVTGEISSIYKKGGKVRKVHNLILLPSINDAEALGKRLEAIGNLHSDGRPILGLDSRDLLEITLDTCPTAMLIPAHIWTPHFSLFGANSGFDAIEDCFEDMTKHVHALETGLSSNPPMNWRLSALDRFVLVSNSDAHSPSKLAREANLFDTELSYPHIIRALEGGDRAAFHGTLEFFPEEGKYHFDGHRNCDVCLDPADTPADGRCPVCGGKLTIGVLHRVEALADRSDGDLPPSTAHFESLVPLPEVLAASTGWSPTSQKGKALYTLLLKELGPELHILRQGALQDIETVAGGAVAEGIRRLRGGDIQVSPGYDGVYGTVSILTPNEREALNGQVRLFADEPRMASRPADNERRQLKSASPNDAAERTQRKNATPSPALRNPLDELNAGQSAAARTTASVVAVIAGPGTGKTKTLAARIVHLVEQRGVQPSRITAVTFTRQAAKEMRERLARHWDRRRVGEMNIGTFHAICLAAMQTNGHSPAIIDDGIALALVEELLQENHWKGSARTALREISLRKCGAPWDAGRLPDGLYDAYSSRLMDDGVMDYDDILLKALDAETPPWQDDSKSFQHILVDEFQDINPVQYRLIQAWGRHSESLFAIGDPNQAIYGFRGADAQCFSRLRADHPNIEEITLHQNYRSTQQILDASRSALPTTASAVNLHAERGSGVRIRIMRADTAFSEAIFAAKEIAKMVGGMDMLSGGAAGAAQPRAFSDIAVLYRTNRQAAVLEECLSQEGIPYIVSGKDGFLAQPDTVRFVAFFRLLHNPEDLLSLRICLRDIASCSAAQCQELIGQYTASAPRIHALAALLTRGSSTTGLSSLARLLEIYGPAPKQHPQKLLAAWTAEQGLNDTPWAERMRKITVFHDQMEDCLTAIALGQEGDVRRYGGKQYNADAVSLMTVHAAKGLEFPVVFLCGLSDGLFPSMQADDEEERRLLYVGMTRARDELVLLHPGEPSPYLANLPPAFCSYGKARPLRKSTGFEQVGLF